MVPMTPRTKHPTGRRPGPETTRADILRAAVELFAERGYEGASLRAITDRAGVDVSMVAHFFGDKRGLFEQAVINQFEHNLGAADALLRGSGPVAPRLAAAFLDLWEIEPSASSMRALLRAALESDENRDVLISVIADRLDVVRQVIDALQSRDADTDGGGPDTSGGANPGADTDFPAREESAAGDNAGRGEDAPTTHLEHLQPMVAHLLGLGVARYLLRVPPLATMSREAVIADMVPIIELSLPGAASSSSAVVPVSDTH